MTFDINIQLYIHTRRSILLKKKIEQNKMNKGEDFGIFEFLDYSL